MVDQLKQRLERWVLVALAVVLGLKARREEQRWVASHPGYEAYRHSTPAIIPHLPGLDWRDPQPSDA